MLIVVTAIERRSLADVAFPARNAFGELGLGLLVGAGLLTGIVGAIALCDWYEVNGLRCLDSDGNALTFAAFGLFSHFLVAALEEVLAGSNTLVDRDERHLALVAERLARVHSVT